MIEKKVRSMRLNCSYPSGTKGFWHKWASCVSPWNPLHRASYLLAEPPSPHFISSERYKASVSALNCHVSGQYFGGMNLVVPGMSNWPQTAFMNRLVPVGHELMTDNCKLDRGIATKRSQSGMYRAWKGTHQGRLQAGRTNYTAIPCTSRNPLEQAHFESKKSNRLSRIEK